MPSNMLMADTGFPAFTGSESTEQKIKVIQNYLYMLLEQLRYMLSNLDTSNWNASALDGFIDEIQAGVVTAETVISNVVITNVLAAEKANIAELTVDQLDTSTKAQNYLSSDTSDVNYIKIYDKTIRLITAQTDGLSAEQATDRNGSPLYWTDAAHAAAGTDVTGYPVYIYDYDEYVKAEISFHNDGTNYIPRITLGAGAAANPDYNKLHIYKDESSAIITYVTDAGAEMTLTLSSSGIIASGNTTSLGIRNIAVGATAPASPQTNDLWIDTDA